VALVPEDDVRVALGSQLDETMHFLARVPASAADARYAPGKWTIREVVGHILDTERIYGFRLLTFARGDRSPLARADQDLYVRAGGFDAYPLQEWAEEFAHVRRSHIAFVSHLPAASWVRSGTVSDFDISVRALAYVMVGHERHHIKTLRERYLQASSGMPRR
jgi:hypothetical protein